MKTKTINDEQEISTMVDRIQSMEDQLQAELEKPNPDNRFMNDLSIAIDGHFRHLGLLFYRFGSH